MSITGEARDVMKNFAEMCKLLTAKCAEGTDRIRPEGRGPTTYDVRRKCQEGRVMDEVGTNKCKGEIG